MLSDERLAEIRASVGGRSAQETVPGFVYRDDVTDLLAEIDRLKRERARIVVRLEEFESNSEEADAKCYACGCYYPGFEEPFSARRMIQIWRWSISRRFSQESHSLYLRQ